MAVSLEKIIKSPNTICLAIGGLTTGIIGFGLADEFIWYPLLLKCFHDDFLLDPGNSKQYNVTVNGARCSNIYPIGEKINAFNANSAARDYAHEKMTPYMSVGLMFGPALVFTTLVVAIGIAVQYYRQKSNERQQLLSRLSAINTAGSKPKVQYSSFETETSTTLTV